MSGIRSILRQFSTQLFFRLIQVVSLTIGFTVFTILLSLAMPGIHSVAISESLARKLYGSIDCLGKELRLNEGWIFYISTVFEDIPEKNH